MYLFFFIIIDVYKLIMYNIYEEVISVNELLKCNICPRNCNVNRVNNELGFCKCNIEIKIANYSLHKWEEPCISGVTGSGTVFFSYCNMQCVYCQNYEISKLHKGKVISIDDLVNIYLELQKKGALNINLVTPTHYVPLIKESLIIAEEKGLTIPIVYNTSSYEKVSSLKSLEGLIDIYLPDLKYYDDNLSLKYSLAKDYFEYATKAIEEMYRQVGKPVFKNGIMQKGVIVRHLVLPGHIEDSKKIIKYLYDTYKNNIYISIMNQFTPVNKTYYNNLNRTLAEEEYDEVVNYAYDIGVRNAFIQEGETCKDSFIPIFTDELEIIKENV